MKIKKEFIPILYLSIVISFVSSILFLSSYELSFAKQDKEDDDDEGTIQEYFELKKSYFIE